MTKREQYLSDNRHKQLYSYGPSIISREELQILALKKGRETRKANLDRAKYLKSNYELTYTPEY